MISPKHRLYLSLAKRLFLRARPPALLNYLRYRCTIGRVRRHGPDVLALAPPSVVIWVTGRCNKDCTFCYYRGELNPSDYEDLELSYDRFIEIMKHPLVSKALRLSLYGGEPLLNRDLFRMIRAGKKHGHLMTVNSNGLLIKERLAEMVADPPDLLSISYYPEDVEALAEGLALIPRGILVRLIMLLSKDRLDDVPDALQLACDTGARSVSFEHTDSTDGSDSQAIDNNDPRLAEMRAEMDAKYGKRLIITWPRPSPDGRAACRFFWDTLFVNALGRTSPCCVWPVKTYEGDIFADPAVWNSERMMALRQRMRNDEFDERCRMCSWLCDDPLDI